jgi:hypothetical protein
VIRPRRFRWEWFLAAPVICAGLLTMTMAGWFRVTLKPFQRYYLIAYLESSFHANRPGATTEIRWLLKTAPGRKARIMLPEDGEAATQGKLPVQLSGNALLKGWQSVVASPPERVPSSELASLLEKAFYPNETLPWLLLEACIASVILLSAAFVYGRAAWRRWGDDVLWECRKCREAWRRIPWAKWFKPASKPARKGPGIQLQESPKARTKPVPAAADTAAVPPPATPAAAQAALPLFDAPAATKPKEAFVWDETKGIE